MEKKLEKLYTRVLEKFGSQPQLWMVVEECGELLDALAKDYRNRATRAHIITELADVSIMVEQMAVLYGLKDFEAERKRKLARLELRLSAHTES